MSPTAPMHRAATAFGLLVAMGLAGRDEALAHLAAAAARAAPARDLLGMRARLAHALDDATAMFELARRHAPWRVRAALAPLLAALAGRRALLAAGFAAAGQTVTPAEARLLVEDAVRRHLRGGRA